jgi:hypothetical protein
MGSPPFLAIVKDMLWMAVDDSLSELLIFTPVRSHLPIRHSGLIHTVQS